MIEITREAYRALIDQDTSRKAHCFNEKSSNIHEEYRTVASGMTIKVVTNYNAMVTQYYLEDINA